MAEQLIVACVNAGDYQGRGQEYVEALYVGVAHNLAFPFEFWCFSDTYESKDRSVKTIPIPHEGLNGWYNKLSLFKPGVFPENSRVLYLDLSCVITGDLRLIASYAGDFCMVHPFIKDNKSPFGGKQSQVMSWKGGFGDHIWERYEASGFAPHAGSDQAIIEACHPVCDTWDKIAPGKVASWKWDLNGRHDPNVSVVCMHGRPKPHNLAAGWVADAWWGAGR